MTREDDPLKQTPICELDRDNRIMTREEEGERAVRESQRAELRKLRAEVERLRSALVPFAEHYECNRGQTATMEVPVSDLARAAAVIRECGHATP